MRSTISTLLLVTMSLVACGKGSGSSPPKPKDVADAVKLVELGQCEAAAKKLRDHTSSNPESFDGFLVLGDALVCSCYDQAGKTPGGMRDAAKCKEALAVYESALKLRKDSVSALVSAGVLSLMLGDEETAAAHLEAATKQDPANGTAANFLALATHKNQDEGGAVALLERHYAKRKPSNVTPPTTEALCGTSLQCGSVVLLESVTQKGALPESNVSKSTSRDDPPPPPEEEPESTEGAGGTGTAMAVAEGKMGKKDSERGQYKMKKVTDGNAVASSPERTYEIGTLIADARLVSGEIAFFDRKYPDTVSGAGYVIKKMPGWRNPDVTSGVVVEKRIPDLPAVPVFYNDNPAYVPKDEWDARARIRALRGQWEYCEETPGRQHHCRTRSGKVALERALGIVTDVTPGSIAVAGAELQIGPSPAFARGAIEYMFVLVPVTYKQHVFAERRLPVSVVAIARVEDLGPQIANLKFLSLAEKRAVLAGQLWKGTPLFIGMRARQHKLRNAALSLREGRVTLRFASDGQVEVYEGGACEAPVNPPLVDPSGEIDEE